MSVFIKEPTKEELTSKGFTNRIKIEDKQTKESLLAYGFTNHNPPKLYYMEMIDNQTSFNLRVCVLTLAIEEIDVLDEQWLQPYDYQAEILNGEPSKKAKKTYHKVNTLLMKLQKDGIIKGFEVGMYI